MSTERSFRRALWGTLGVLALLIAGLTVATVAHGPRVTGVEVSTAGVVEREGGRMRIRLDQAVDASVSERITVAPAAAFSAEVDGSDVTLTFADTLRYATEYTVTMTQARGETTGSAADLEASFTTLEPELFTLDRAVDQPDRIRMRPLTGGDASVVFEAPRILDYAVVGVVLVAVVALEDDGNAIETVSLDTGARGIIPLPSAGTVRELHASPARSLVGYTVTTLDGEYDRALFAYDLTDQKGEPVVVPGLDGAPISARDWAFVPDSTGAVVQTPDDTVLRVDLVQAGAITPLGQHAELRGFVPGTAALVVADPESGTVIDLESGAETVLALPFAVVAPTAYFGELLLLGADSYLQTISDYASGDAAYSVVLVDADGTRELYRPAGAGARILATCLSPNGQYLAVETVPADAARAATGFTDVTTVLLDVQTGATNRSVSGTSLDWC